MTDEQALRADFARRGIELTDITPRPDLHLGAAYVVRHAGGGGLAIVRGSDVISEPTAASVDRLIELDGPAEIAKIPPRHFVAFLQQWHAMPADLGASPIKEMTDPRIAPQWAMIDGKQRFILHAARSSNAGARQTKAIAMRRAIGTLGPKGLTWEFEDIDVPA